MPRWSWCHRSWSNLMAAQPAGGKSWGRFAPPHHPVTRCRDRRMASALIPQYWRASPCPWPSHRPWGRCRPSATCRSQRKPRTRPEWGWSGVRFGGSPGLALTVAHRRARVEGIVGGLGGRLRRSDRRTGILVNVLIAVVVQRPANVHPEGLAEVRNACDRTVVS